MEKIKLEVEGMHCPSCEMLITDSIKELPGVAHAIAHHKTNIVEVSFDKTKTKKEDIIDVIKKEGYKVKR